MGDSYIIAIDFGTAYSGYAFSITHSEAEPDPHFKNWGSEVGKETPKAPTCILFDEREEFLSFGYEAKEDYVRMQNEEAKKKFFFNCFKMSLYCKKLDSKLTIKAANGKSMKALKVIAETLRYLKDDALKTITENTADRKFIALDFTWVLTVPAIWDPSAKQFMREAATQAEIVSRARPEKLVIALEPEAASIWCKNLPANGFIAENQGGVRLDQSPGTRYIVVDCGGGTIDITVHEVLDGGRLKELCKASGNDMAGQTVDRNFKQFLREIFCKGVWDEYEKKHPSEVQRILYDFPRFKKRDKDVEISCPLNLGKMAMKKQKIEKFFSKVDGASWNNGSIQIEKSKLREFFNESLTGITGSLTEIMEKGLSINYILLVGGFAESQILREHVINHFGDQCKVLCPVRPQVAIMKGAVMFGRNPAMVASRKSAFTYGLAVSKRFRKFRHRMDKKFTNKEGEWCGNIFMKLVEIDEEVGWEETRQHTRKPISTDQTNMTLAFYRTEKKNPKYVDEDGLKMMGSLVVNMPDTRRGMDRQVTLKIKFGFTEMTATATDVDSGSTESIELNFLTKSW